VVPHFQGGAVSHAQQTLDAKAHASGKREDYAAQQLQAVATMTERYQQEVAGGR
jgi:limonene 1,2-monooxygenase